MRESNIIIQPKPQSGYLLIEVLVSMIIILLGLVGIAKLQHVAKIAHAQAVQRTIASNLASNLIERIRSNPAGIGTYFPSDATRELNGSTSYIGPPCTSGSPCAPVELAAYDIWEWEQSLTGALETVSTASTGGLVNPVVCLKREAGGGNGIYHMAIVWHGHSKLQYQTIAANANASTCGTTDSAYDDSGNDNVYRRVHWQEIFLDV